MEDKLRIGLSSLLHQFNDGEEILTVPCCKAAELPAQIADGCPQLGTHLFNRGGEVSGFINIYINGLNQRDLDPGQPLSPKDRIEIITSLVGG